MSAFAQDHNFLAHHRKTLLADIYWGAVTRGAGRGRAAQSWLRSYAHIEACASIALQDAAGGHCGLLGQDEMGVVCTTAVVCYI